MKHAHYWIKMQATDPEQFAKLNAASRLKHKVRRRLRATKWNRDNPDRRNQRRRQRYAEKKAETKAKQGKA